MPNDIKHEREAIELPHCEFTVRAYWPSQIEQYIHADDLMTVLAEFENWMRSQIKYSEKPPSFDQIIQQYYKIKQECAPWHE